MTDLDTAEYRKLALIAAGVPLESIPPIIDTATWRHMLIAALLKNAASQVLAGSVDYYSQLPTTLGSPAIGATYLVRNASGIYYINYKSAGVYIKVLDTGSLTDWVYTPLTALGTLPDVTLTNPQVGDTLTWNGSRWVNTKSKLDSYQFRTSDLVVSGSNTQLSVFTQAVEANKRYKIECNFILINASGGSYSQVTYPSGAAMYGSVHSVSNSSGAVLTGDGTWDTNNTWFSGSASAKGSFVCFLTLVTGATPGNVVMRHGTYLFGGPATLKAGSYMKVQEF